MQDDRIVELYWQRSEAAIRHTDQKYGHYLMKLSYNILADWEDSKESVNDTYLSAWKSMPPHRPNVLLTYLCKITRQISIDVFRKRNSVKRQASEYALSLSELEDCVSAGNTTEQEVDLRLLAKAIQDYLAKLPEETRDVFIGRYFFSDSICDIAGYYDMSKSKAKSMLYRTRIGLKKYLEQEGFFNET
ncbi:MAG: sigma-70 family RNA polymerase sigma factor [Lachnospiraceae bacterium]|nr:sigma-70 family RNA polymerase sigma factor [Lachnospiraceae bacterium]